MRMSRLRRVCDEIGSHVALAHASCSVPSRDSVELQGYAIQSLSLNAIWGHAWPSRAVELRAWKR